MDELELLLTMFPKLDDTAAAAILHARRQWLASCDERVYDLTSEQREVIEFAAGWMARPASDFSC